MLQTAGMTPAGTLDLATAGRGELVVVRGGAGGGERSLVSRAYATSPLRWLLPANHGSAAWVYASSYGGGLVDGDALALDIEVGPGAEALVSTQASTKVYRSPRGTSAVTRARVAPGGLLILLPDPVVCFAGSRYRQTQRIDVAGGGGLVLLDWVTSGRRAAGERWEFEEYVSRTTVHLAGRLALLESLALRAADGELASRFGRFDILALLVVVGEPLRREAAVIAASLGDGPPARRAEQLVAMAPLGEAGCVVRIAGRSVERVGRTVRKLLDFVPSRIGDDPWRRRW